MAEGSDTTFAELEKLADNDRAPGASAAPSGTARQSGGKSRAASAGTRRTNLEKRLSDFFASIGLIVSAFDPHCGQIVVAQAPELARVWEDVAQNDPRIKKILEGLMTSGTYSQAIMVTGMTLLPILQHHGLMPFRMFGVIEGEGGDGEPSTSTDGA